MLRGRGAETRTLQEKHLCDARLSFQWMRRRRSRLWIAQAMLPLRPGQVERRTHDYKRHGTASLYAAFNIATGDVLGRITEQHRAKEFLDFLKQIDRAHTQSVELHLILDNSSTHKTPDVNRWLEAHPRFKLHFTSYIDAHNLASAKPFVWTKSAESILAAVDRAKCAMGTTQTGH